MRRKFGRRRFCYFLGYVICIGTILKYLVISRIPRPTENVLDFQHFRTSRNVRDYLDNIKLLIEPSSPPCTNVEEVQVITLVFTSPSRSEYRKAIRSTWGPRLPTFFILGLDRNSPDELLIENYMEAKQYDDLIVYEFTDHYQNLTIKTVLMLQWTLERCPQAEFLFKVDDDVVVNPWTLKEVINDNVDAKLVGRLRSNVVPHREAGHKRYIPPWLYSSDTIPHYLAGPSYLVNGEYIKPLLKTSFSVPMINLEDVYLTYLVASKLGYKVTNDDRFLHLSQYWILPKIMCSYWHVATIHDFQPKDILSVWAVLKKVGEDFENGRDGCTGALSSFYAKLSLKWSW